MTMFRLLALLTLTGDVKPVSVYTFDLYNVNDVMAAYITNHVAGKRCLSTYSATPSPIAQRVEGILRTSPSELTLT